MTAGGFDTLDGDVIARVEQIVDAATKVDGTAPISEQAVLSLSGSSVTHLVRTTDDRVVGYGQISAATGEHPAMAEVVVDPEHRGKGVGTDLVQAALTAGGAGTRVWAHGNLEPARAVAARLKLVAVRELLQMRRPLTNNPVPSYVVPDGLSLRTYRPGADDAEILRVNNAAFSWHPEQGGWTAADLSARQAEEWFDPAGLFLVVDDQDRVRGFHWTKVHTETPEPIGEVYVVAIDPAAQGAGLGRVLTLAGLEYLQVKGLDAVLLYTEADNAAAVRLYEKLGFTRYHVDVAYGTAVTSVTV
ncbi:mycothiol synthase [Antrihabitans sp. YC2-6]|uniref:mycothiol synthase n=1 Tax=Antrihabitans sp. YC2-6 TaxID=2799498 RepID=UPI0018F43A88|nr:mycothiol synthase [Antrihabitans sp. YC2-6]MBJ8344529.1 mycothiol synthase [Antrihabitans sp. YC2-6]